MQSSVQRTGCGTDFVSGAYTAYKTLAAADRGITLAFCWSHVRREFIELARGKTAPIEVARFLATAFRFR